MLSWVVTVCAGEMCWVLALGGCWGISVWRRRKAGPPPPTHVSWGFLLSITAAPGGSQQQETASSARLLWLIHRSHQSEQRRKWLLLFKRPTQISDWNRTDDIPRSNTQPLSIHWRAIFKNQQEKYLSLSLTIGHWWKKKMLQNLNGTNRALQLYRTGPGLV